MKYRHAMHAHKPCGVGIDIVEISRIRNIAHLERFAEYILTAREMREFRTSRDPLRFVASRFAAKEAVIKAFPGRITPHEFSIVKKGGKPTVRFFRKHAAGYHALISLSHSTEYAAGYAVLY